MIFPAFPPAFILNHSPEIILAFEMDFLRNSALFQKAIPRGKKFTMHLQPGWSAEFPEASAELKKRLAEAQKVFPEARFIFPANTYREMEILKEFSCETSCGLALSSIEGAMFSSREYSLCGIPAGNTGNLEGRDMRLPDFSIRYTADNTESVAENAEYRVTHPVEPEAIREEFLRLEHPPQKQIQDLVNTIAGKKVNLPHKRNIRCRMLPHNKLLHGIRRPLQ